MLFKGTDVHLHVDGAELCPIAGIGETSPQIAQMGADQERPGGFAQKTQTSPQMTLITLIYTDQSSIEPF
jgi:hypothetical protein